MIKIGDKVEVDQMPKGSFYKKVRGEVTKVDDNGWVYIKATEVMDKWSAYWEKHPTLCCTSARIENVEITEAVGMQDVTPSPSRQGAVVSSLNEVFLSPVIDSQTTEEYSSVDPSSVIDPVSAENAPTYPAIGKSSTVDEPTTEENSEVQEKNTPTTIAKSATVPGIVRVPTKDGGMEADWEAFVNAYVEEAYKATDSEWLNKMRKNHEGALENLRKNDQQLYSRLIKTVSEKEKELTA